MAGETEDCITLQAEHLPTGSISFGRFELEHLSWEKRSSFNHNRYLEEVEKYSRPGSVTQKRAILEAHFKKKSLNSQTSLETKSNAECQPTEIVLHHDASCPDEFENRGDGRQPEFASYGDTPIVSDKHEVVECEQEVITWPAESLVESMSCNSETAVGPTNELTDCDEMLQRHAEYDSLPSNKDDLCIVIEQEPDNKAVIMEELLGKKEVVVAEEIKSCVSSKSPANERKTLPTLKKRTQRAALKVKEEVDQKTVKPIRKDQLPAQKNLRKSSTERSHTSSGKMFSNSMAKPRRESTSINKSVKQIQPRTSRPRTSESRSLKSEDPVNMKGLVRQTKGSEKHVRAMEADIAPRLISGTREMCARQAEKNRPKRVVDCAKEGTKPTRVVFNFRSDERAEKRKEYNMKLGEKLHAKEVEMNEIQAKTQEEIQDAIKQLRRGLNFKATPMPSFYHEAVQKVCGGRKVAPPPKPQRSQAKGTSLRSQNTTKEKSQSLLKASSNHLDERKKERRGKQAESKY